MKTFHKLSYLLSLVCIVSFSSCHQDEDKDPVKSDAELIGSGIAWKFSTVTASGLDASSFIDECLLDNLITFTYSSKTGVVDAGPIKCDESDPQTEEFTWRYNDSTKILSFDSDVIDIPGAASDLKVISVTSAELVLSQNVALPGFGTQEVIVTLIH
ncbi:lipocalin-like domain-containing protein [Algoriphagus chordae]|uniref:Lipocalin-like domain-containing protein n=1 Tax=Algoriphagus chordae TaxID=237019 RepID=A0A2W7QZB8_9BACT|nr:lipocalin family protein [Algoriphagus chordae]PZX53261.1 hypothetical protein LV85_01679 [Algoriphagus chordae]